mmetsp:Transcript_19919/g.59605  ORF Transcript_19919/g.59605 Transcript_19919/m.59605 type:complete len:267 (+) Transcript_19919:1385-2185(+)
MKCTKCSTWTSSVDLTWDAAIDCATLPRKVLSPVACTTQVALPFCTVVPKKARFRASVGGSTSLSVFATRVSGIDSPVKAELSTCMPSVQCKIRTSAGTRSPDSRKMTSPGTKFTTSNCMSTRNPTLLRRTVGTGLSPCILCIASMASSANISVYHCSTAVAMRITDRRIGVSLSSLSELPWKRVNKATIASTHIQSKTLKMPPKIMRNSLAHLFSLAGGVMRFGPNISNTARAWSSLRPTSPCLQRPSSENVVLSMAASFAEGYE